MYLVDIVILCLNHKGDSYLRYWLEVAEVSLLGDPSFHPYNSRTGEAKSGSLGKSI